MCVCVCVHVCMCECVYIYMYVCMHVRKRVHSIYILYTVFMCLIAYIVCFLSFCQPRVRHGRSLPPNYAYIYKYENFICRRFIYKGDTSTHARGTDPGVALGAFVSTCVITYLLCFCSLCQPGVRHGRPSPPNCTYIYIYK